jgi:hypothetical protein
LSWRRPESARYRSGPTAPCHRLSSVGDRGRAAPWDARALAGRACTGRWRHVLTSISVRLVVVLGHAASMANRHFGKLADVWKHLVLAEALAAVRPQSLWDTHAGHAVYTMTTDAERRFGVLRFMDLAPRDAALATSGYFRLLEGHMQAGSGLSEYPAGPMIAMLQLGRPRRGDIAGHGIRACLRERAGVCPPSVRRARHRSGAGLRRPTSSGRTSRRAELREDGTPRLIPFPSGHSPGDPTDRPASNAGSVVVHWPTDRASLKRHTASPLSWTSPSKAKPTFSRMWFEALRSGSV